LYNDYFTDIGIETPFNEFASLANIELNVLYSKLKVLTDKSVIVFLHQSACKITPLGIRIIEENNDKFKANVDATKQLRNSIIKKIAEKLNRNEPYSSIHYQEIVFDKESDRIAFQSHWLYLRDVDLLDTESANGFLQATHHFWEYYDDITSPFSASSAYRYDIFLVHAAEDQEFTDAISKQFQNIFGLKPDRVFAASNSKSIRSGNPWYSHIVEAHKSSKVGVVLLTHNSAKRPWVNFEVGGFVLRNNNPPISICCCKDALDKIEFPISGLQFKKLYEKNDRDAIIEELSVALDLPKLTYSDEAFVGTIDKIRSASFSENEVDIMLDSSGPSFYTQLMHSNFTFIALRINNKTNIQLEIENIFLEVQTEGGWIKLYHIPFVEPAYFKNNKILPYSKYETTIPPRNNIRFFSRFQSAISQLVGSGNEDRVFRVTLIMSDGKRYSSDEIVIKFIYYERAPLVGEKNLFDAGRVDCLIAGCPDYSNSYDKIIFDDSIIGKNHDAYALIEEFKSRALKK